MPEMRSTSADWPELTIAGWRETYATLHMWTQVVGKVCLALTLPTNHFWNIAFQVVPRGLATPSLTYGNRAFTITFDFIAHELVVQSSDGRIERIRLEPQTVADFYRTFMDRLHRLDIDVHVWKQPVEVPEPVAFDRDTLHRSYDPAWANAFGRALVAMKPVFERFRGGFVGKCSPVHFFWGSFDLAVTRFSGRRAPERPDADPVTREAYSHEVISHGFWPGSAAGPVREPAFYSYAAPEPAGLKTAAVQPSDASYDIALGEFILPYESVRKAPEPGMALLAFLESTYARAADLAGWPRADLERGDNAP